MSGKAGDARFKAGEGQASIGGDVELLQACCQHLSWELWQFGGEVSISSGAGAGEDGNISIAAAIGSSSGHVEILGGGEVSLVAGEGDNVLLETLESATDAPGSGDFAMKTGSSFGASSGSIQLATGTSLSGQGGGIALRVGSGDSGTGGAVDITAGESTAGSGGLVTLHGGEGSIGGVVDLQAGDGFDMGGSLMLQSGQGTFGPSGNISLAPQMLLEEREHHADHRIFARGRIRVGGAPNWSCQERRGRRGQCLSEWWR